MKPPRRLLAALALVVGIGGAAAWSMATPSPASVSAMAAPAWREALAEARDGAEASALREVALRQIADAGSDAARAEGVRMLGYVGRPADVPLLAELIDAPSVELRLAAVHALGAIGGDAAVGLLTRIVEAEDAQIVAEAWAALGTTAHPDALALMDARLREGRDLQMVAGALARTGSPEAARALAEAFAEAGPNDAWALASALASFSQDVPEARKALLVAATGPDAQRRTCALAGLAQSGDPGLFDLVDRALADGDPARLGEIVNALASVHDPRALVVLRRLVDTGASSVASSAVYAIGAIGSPEAEAILLDVIAHGRPDIASQAVWSLRAPTSDEAVPVLAAASHDRPMVVRQAAIQRLMQGPWGSDGVPEVVLAVAREQIEGAGVYGTLPPEAFALLLDHGAPSDAELVRSVIDEAPTWQRVTAVSALRGRHAPWIHDLVLGLVADPDPSVAQAAFDVAMERPEMRAPLERALIAQLEEGPSWAACQGLARLGTPAALGELYDRIESGTSNEAIEAASALASWGDREALDNLVGMLDDVEDAQVRHTLYSSLLYRTDLDMAAIAERALAETDPNIRAMATTALAQSGAPDARAKLIELVHDEDLSVRSSALYALAQVGGPEAEALASELVEDPELGSTALSTLAQLGTRSARERIGEVALTAEREDVRMQAIYSLASSPGRATEEVLMQALGDESSSVRIAAISTLQSTGSRRASEALVPLLDADPDDPTAWSEAQQAASALQALGGPAYEAHQERVTEVLGSGWAGMYGGLGYIEYGEGPYPEPPVAEEEEDEAVEVLTGDGGTVGRQAELITVGLTEPEQWLEELGEPLPGEALVPWGEAVPNEEIDFDQEWLEDEGYEPNASADTGR